MDGTPAITIRNLTFSFNGAPVLEDVNLSVAAGDLVSMVGPNGGGKSTLLKLMVGLLRPDRGEISVFGRSPVEARSRIGYMPQHASLDARFPVSVLDVVLMGRLGRKPSIGPFRRADRLAAEMALRQVDLADMGNVPLAELSGGQQQRVLIARALASEPDLLLLDEPTANLDLRVEGEFFRLLRKLNERMTVIIVSHDLGFVSGMMRSCVCVNRRVHIHPTSEITGEILQELYGGDVRLVRHDVCKTCPNPSLKGRQVT